MKRSISLLASLAVIVSAPACKRTSPTPTMSASADSSQPQDEVQEFARAVRACRGDLQPTPEQINFLRDRVAWDLIGAAEATMAVQAVGDPQMVTALLREAGREVQDTRPRMIRANARSFDLSVGNEPCTVGPPTEDQIARARARLVISPLPPGTPPDLVASFEPYRSRLAAVGEYVALSCADTHQPLILGRDLSAAGAHRLVPIRLPPR